MLMLAFLLQALQAAPIGCQTPIGIPCSTIRYETRQWVVGGLTRLAYFTSSSTAATRSDGSRVSIDASEAYGMLRDSRKTGGTFMYMASGDRVIRIDHERRTISYRQPIIWHDRPYRRSKHGDATCATGILHQGTDFKLAGDGVIAGIPTKKWDRGDGLFWYEESYLAPSLDCAVLKHYVVRRNRLLIPTFITSMEVVSVRLGEPDAGLFDIPVNYQEVKDPMEDRLREFVARNKGLR